MRQPGKLHSLAWAEYSWKTRYFSFAKASKQSKYSTSSSSDNKRKEKRKTQDILYLIRHFPIKPDSFVFQDFLLCHSGKRIFPRKLTRIHISNKTYSLSISLSLSLSLTQTHTVLFPLLNLSWSFRFLPPICLPDESALAEAALLSNSLTQRPLPCRAPHGNGSGQGKASYLKASYWFFKKLSSWRKLCVPSTLQCR